MQGLVYWFERVTVTVIREQYPVWSTILMNRIVWREMEVDVKSARWAYLPASVCFGSSWSTSCALRTEGSLSTADFPIASPAD